jgi:hypothetical protein
VTIGTIGQPFLHIGRSGEKRREEKRRKEMISRMIIIES